LAPVGAAVSQRAIQHLITGVATTFVPTLDVWRRSVCRKKNLIITSESHTGIQSASIGKMIQHLDEQEIIARNSVIYRCANWMGLNGPARPLAG